MKDLINRIADTSILHGIVIGIQASFSLIGPRSKRFQEAVRDFEAIYLFRTESAARCLIFSGKRISTKNGAIDSPDFELVLKDPVAVVKQFASNPNDVIRLLMENKIDQRGNNYYLFKLGYLLGLCDQYLQDLPGRIVPDFIEKLKMRSKP